MPSINNEPMSGRDSLIVILIIVSFVSLFFIAPIPQDLDYHNFADKRGLYGINNFLDVASNLPFLLVGLLGFHYIFKNWGITSSSSWLIFFTSIFFVGIGSSYYHLNPVNETLTWDRLPMAIGFMALFVIVLTDFINHKLEKWLLIPMCLIGAISVAYWYVFDDLRFYGWVQFVSMALLLIIIFIYKPEQLQRKYILYAYVFYTLSKLAEYFDKQIFELADQLISGHAIKHLFASLATYCFYILLKRQVK
jgi:hypothetical protein